MDAELTGVTCFTIFFNRLADVRLISADRACNRNECAYLAIMTCRALFVGVTSCWCLSFIGTGTDIALIYVVVHASCQTERWVFLHDAIVAECAWPSWL